jgi:isopentenyldiphosphate isomerase
MSADEIIPIVDENDNIIGYKMRKDVKLSDIYRVSAIILRNSKNQILLAQRGFHKSKNPWAWSVSVAGTVEKWETYEENIKKELFEEIGIKDIPITEVLKMRSCEKHQFFVMFYEATLDRAEEDFILEEGQVEQVKWFSREEFEIFKNDKNNIIGKNFLKALEKYNFFVWK